MTVISGTLIGPYGEALPGVTIEMVAVRTTATVLEQASSRFVTDTNGRYSLKVEPGRYNVMVSASGQPAARVGSIIVELTSSTGTLNDFLTKPGEEDLTPEIVKTVDQMRAAAANSAAAAKVSENNSAAAMTNALSKVDTADQSVASTVLFSKPIRLASGIAANFIPKTEGAWASWSRAAGRGSTDFVNHRGNGSGGYWFYDTDGATIKALAYLNGAGDLTTIGSLTSSNMYIGSTPVIKAGEFGIGGVTPYINSATAMTDIQTMSTGIYVVDPSPTNGMPTTTDSYCLNWNRTYAGKFGLAFATALVPNNSASQGVYRNRLNGSTFQGWVKIWDQLNTTVDANGFIKKASPIVKLFADGSSELNGESQGVTTERLSEGVYRISGVFGFNGDGAWGGPGNGIEIPVDDNKRPLIWVESKVLPDGDIEIRTYHRTYDTGPYSARNIEAMDSGEVGKKKQPIFVEMPDGTPIDIPVGRWIDLRVEMPAVDEPEPGLEPEIEPELETEPEAVAPVEPTVPELTPEPVADPEPSPAVVEGVEQDRPVSDRKPIF